MTALDKTASNIPAAKARLREHASRIEVDPRTNSVFAYAQELFQQLEAGAIGLDDLKDTALDVYGERVLARAARFRRQHEDAPDLAARLNALAKTGWDAFKQAVETPLGGVVFTAHPTFAMSRATRAAFADHVTQDTKASAQALTTSIREDGRAWSASISLPGEHDEVQDTITHAQAALSQYADLVLSTAQAHFPDTWRRLTISVPTLASWVGYDLDGRTDIHWSQSFALRLREKAVQLARYTDELAGLAAQAGGETSKNLNALHAQFERAAALTAGEAETFSADLTDADNLVAAANALTKDAADRIVETAPFVAQLQKLAAAETDDALARAILVLAAKMDALKLGTARIHLRLNAEQIRTVISRDLGLETENRDLGRSALNKLSTLAAVKEPLNVNFADLFLEQSTARRQFMMCAQFLKHIDADSTIRFLIAESENPATVMGALYLARQYGVDHQLDISPLFETPEALETGGRFIEQLLQEPEYRTYLKGRGYLSVQLGFSDAGRFIGQVSADMAIERIHNLISRAVADAKADLSLLIFNTHGESMGRGAWPGSFDQRFDHLLSHWTRQQSRQRGVPLRHEVSFQGGDGYLHFANDQLAAATYNAFADHLLSDPSDAAEDPFYSRTDLVWDFYRALRRWHERLFANPNYGHLLNDFATNFLIKAGSRQRRRSSGPAGPRSLRAISHNATLQQLGVPLNTAAGIGSALRRERDQVNDLIQDSPRMRGLMRLASMARSATSVPVLRAYANLYDPSFWVALSTATDDGDKALAYRRIYYLLQDRQTLASIEKIANMLSIDFSKFDPMLSQMEKVPSKEERHEVRLDVHILHAIRQALMMKALALAGQLPTVSRRHESNVVDIMNLIRAMQIGDAVKLLCEIFPASREEEARLEAISEPGHMTGSPANGYDQLHEEVIKPLDEIDRQMHMITLAVCQAYGAYG
ncbi:MAG: phosphoenolpyruvate carboxylase [Hyphomonadaceae bacterium]|nr:phosphoenolpyruvate carboxylase [Hyphomonadaceae bacterium]